MAVSNTKKQEALEEVLKAELLSADGESVSVTHLQKGFAVMRQRLDAMGADESDQRDFTMAIDRAINEAIWHDQDHREIVLDILWERFKGRAREGVICPFWKRVRFLD